MRSLGQKPSTTTKEKSAMPQHDGPVRTRAGRLNECFARWISNSALGESFGYWASKTIALPQLRRLVGAEIPWTTLQKPLSDSTVVLLSTGGVHLRSDRSFNLNSDAIFRVIPKDAQPDDLAISHQAYDRTDALTEPYRRPYRALGVRLQIRCQQPTTGLCRVIYLEAFRKDVVQSQRRQ